MKRLLALLLGTLLALGLTSACASSAADSKYYHFTGGTKLDTLIPTNDRKQAQNFTGSLLSGGTFNLKKYAGKIMVLNFWGSWCPPCRLETPQFGQISNQYQHKGVQFVGIDVKEASRSTPRNFLAQSHVTYPNIYDEDGRTALTLGNISTAANPFTVLLDKKHRVAGVYISRLAPADIEPLLNKLIAEK